MRLINCPASYVCYATLNEIISLKIVHYPVHVNVDKPVPYEVKGKRNELKNNSFALQL